MHVVGGKTGLGKGIGHFDVRIDTLLAQHRHTRPVLQKRRRHGARCGRQTGGQMHVQTRVGRRAKSGMFGVGAGGVVPALTDLPADAVPDLGQIGQWRAEYRFGVAPHFQLGAVAQGFANHMAMARQAVGAQNRHHGVAVLAVHLQHHAQLFGEQGAQRGFLAAGANLGRPVFAIAHVHAAVVNAVTLQDQHVYIEGHTLAPRESHLRHSSQQTAIAAVVVGQNFSVRAQGVDRLHQGDQIGRLVQVRHFMAHLVQGLRQDAGAHAVFAAAQVHQNQTPVFHRLKLRRERAAHIGQAGKGRDNQRDRRADFFGLTVLLPLGAHGQRVFAHRNRNAQGRAQLHADGAHGGIQRRVFARLAASGHPIGRELDARQVDGRS